MTRRCSCAPPLTEAELFAASTIGVRIKHDAEPCLPPSMPETGTNALFPKDASAERPGSGHPRPVLTRLPRLTVVAGK